MELIAFLLGSTLVGIALGAAESIIGTFLVSILTSFQLLIFATRISPRIGALIFLFYVIVWIIYKTSARLMRKNNHIIKVKLIDVLVLVSVLVSLIGVTYLGGDIYGDCLPLFANAATHRLLLTFIALFIIFADIGIWHFNFERE